MFCAFCGYEVGENSAFCTKCGRKQCSNHEGNSSLTESTPNTNSSHSAGFKLGASASASGKRCLSFESFYAKKSNERSSHFKVSKTSCKKRCDEPLETFVNVGVMKHEKGETKPIRGKTLPLKVNKDVGYDEFLEAALVKRKAYDRSFDESLKWMLVYSDGKLARTLPGSIESFSVRKYKEDIGKPYSRITLYLCPLFPTDEVTDNPESAENDFFYVDADYEPIPIDILEEMLPEETVLENAFSNSDANSCTNVTSNNSSPLPTTSPDPIVNDNISAPIVIDDTGDDEEWSFLGDALKSKFNAIVATKVVDRLKLVVRRRKIWSDTMEKLALFFWPDAIEQSTEEVTLQPSKCSLDVKFIGEEGVDQGGLTRDFFSSVFDAARTHVMQGNDEKQYFTLQHNCLALESREYFFYGMLVGLALLHGCPGPRNWTPSLAGYILQMEKKESSIDEVPDYEVREKLRCLSKCESEEQLEELLCNFPERFDAGYTKGHISFEEKNSFITKIVRHFVISVCLEEIQQLTEGLKKVGILPLLQRFKEGGMKELTPSTNLSPAAILDFWGAIYSPAGSNKRITEEDIVYNFSCFLDEVAQGRVNGIPTLDVESGQLVEASISLQDVFQFLTGAKYFCQSLSQASLEFDHEAVDGKRIDVSTCSLTLNIPCNSRYTGSSKDFIKNLSEDIVCSPGFGKA